jgi:hypothetical protein
MRITAATLVAVAILLLPITEVCCIGSSADFSAFRFMEINATQHIE